MKILYVCNTVYPFYIGGYERRYFEISKRLAKRGHLVVLLTSVPRNYDFHNLYFEKVTYFESFFNDKGFRSIPKELIFSGKLMERFLSKLGKEFDIIEVNQTPFFHIIVSKLYTIIKEKPLLCTIHEALTPYIDVYLRKRLRNKIPSVVTSIISSYLKASIVWTQKLCDYVIAVSESVKQGLIAEGINDSKIFVVPNGVDIGRIEKYTQLRNEIKCDDKVNITFIGRLVPEKRPHYLINVARKLLSKGIRRFCINIVGSGPLLTKLQELVRVYDLHKYVNILGYVKEEEKYKILAKTDIFVLPSLREGFSLATLEAMAFGIPVVVTSLQMPGISGFVDYVKHGYNGFIAHSLSEFLKYIEALILDEKLRLEIGINARATARIYDWNNIVSIIESIYRKVAKMSTVVYRMDW